VRAARRYEATRLAAMLLLGFLVGLLSGQYLLSMLIALAVYLAEHFYQLLRLVFLTDTQQRLKPPYPAGFWGDIYRAIALHQTRSRKRKRGLVRFATRFREAAGAIPDALVILDKEQCVEWANPSAHSLLGLSWPACEGKPINHLLDYPELHRYIEQGEYHQPMDYAPPHNSAIVLSLRVTPFGGKKRQRLLVARDITKIYHLNQIRRDFVANVSHELRTPLTVFNGFVENLMDARETPERLQRPLHLMHRQAARMQSIIHDLLTLSRLEMDEKASDQQPINVPAMLEGIVHEATALSDGHTVELDADPELWLLGNEGEIRSAFTNLVVNAVRHTPPGTEIQVIWHHNDRISFLIVQDSGEGIAPQHLPRLTERFYRVDKDRSRASGGTGLGLAIVKHALHRHEAELHIASEEGNGSTFTCRFPAELAIQHDRDTAAESVSGN
jgi:two-component system phosphate regulon sensor histidine kinase PhoR